MLANPSACDNAFQTCAAHASIELMVFRGRAQRRNKNQETGQKMTLTSASQSKQYLFYRGFSCAEGGLGQPSNSLSLQVDMTL